MFTHGLLIRIDKLSKKRSKLKSMLKNETDNPKISLESLSRKRDSFQIPRFITKNIRFFSVLSHDWPQNGVKKSE